jgi:hypothetical protein
LHQLIEAAGLHGVEHGRQDVRHIAVKGTHQFESLEILGADDLAAILIAERTRSALARKKAAGALLGNRTNLADAQAMGQAGNRQAADAFAANIRT